MTEIIKSFSHQPSPNRLDSGANSSSFSATRIRWINNPAGGVIDPAKVIMIMEEKRRIREAEKAEKVMQLICWGCQM
ncbi:hypothetical protein BVC80_1433g39 [Macleaya cordata]|uniref:Uncharacterized protein n=1 Tax=Macleaya cordata TaxID=56857 RepID=A0A200QBY0_MACCD|nr:hypothetical protein BVC80_1433g39 [Macleaya cordata]